MLRVLVFNRFQEGVEPLGYIEVTNNPNEVDL